MPTPTSKTLTYKQLHKAACDTYKMTVEDVATKYGVSKDRLPGWFREAGLRYDSSRKPKQKAVHPDSLTQGSDILKRAWI